MAYTPNVYITKQTQQDVPPVAMFCAQTEPVHVDRYLIA